VINRYTTGPKQTLKYPRDWNDFSKNHNLIQRLSAFY